MSTDLVPPLYTSAGLLTTAAIAGQLGLSGCRIRQYVKRSIGLGTDFPAPIAAWAARHGRRWRTAEETTKT